MKKELKALIKEKKFTDEQILTILQSHVDSESEQDILDETDESEEQSDSKETDNAEKPAAKEQAKNKLSMQDLGKIIAESVANALKADKEANLLPAQKPLVTKKSEPKAKPKAENDGIQLDPNGNLVF